MLKEVDRYTIGYVWPFFESLPYDSLLDAAVHDYHGKVETDDFSHPHVVLATIGTHTFGKSYYIAGELNHAATQDVIKNLDTNSELHIPDSWKPNFEKVINRPFTLKTRYDFHHSSINKKTLENFLDELPKGYTIASVNKTIYNDLRAMPWSYFMVGNFKDYNDYRAHGLGYVIKKDDQIISGASSFIRYNQGYEIEIGTHEAFRRQGLATVIAAKFILETLEEGKVPHWDAANAESKALALKLGYTLKNTYSVYEL